MKYLEAFKAKSQAPASDDGGFVGDTAHTHIEIHEDSNIPINPYLPTLPTYSKELHAGASNSIRVWSNPPTKPPRRRRKDSPVGSVGSYGSRKSKEGRVEAAARGDELRRQGRAVPLCWLPPPQDRVALQPLPGKRADGKLWFE
jgi:hypothetical protein